MMCSEQVHSAKALCGVRAPRPKPLGVRFAVTRAVFYASSQWNKKAPPLGNNSRPSFVRLGGL